MNLKVLLRRIVSALLLCVTALVLIWRFYPFADESAGPTSLALKAPSFISVARAEEIAIASTIGDEAGVSAWYQATSAINLTAVRSQFRTVERETSDYIIGSVGVTNYDESEDVHVYIHKDGWVLAYYLAAAPAGKIFDWRVYKASNGATITTKLENTIALVLGSVGISFSNATYYDFRYPNATHLMIVAENNENRDESFTINLPGSFSYFERSWFIGRDGSNYGAIYLNGTKLVGDIRNANAQGTLLATQLLPDQSHTIRVNNGYGGLVLIYKEQ